MTLSTPTGPHWATNSPPPRHSAGHRSGGEPTAHRGGEAGGRGLLSDNRRPRRGRRCPPREGDDLRSDLTEIVSPFRGPTGGTKSGVHTRWTLLDRTPLPSQSVEDSLANRLDCGFTTQQDSRWGTRSDRFAAVRTNSDRLGPSYSNRSQERPRRAPETSTYRHLHVDRWHRTHQTK